MHAAIDRRRRALVITALGAAVVAGAAPADGAFPSAPVKIVNSFPPGGPSDILSRLLAEKAQAALKQPFIVENKPGAGGNIAADQVARAPADGTTILSGIDTTFTVNPNLYKSIPFKPEELKPLIIMASSGLLFGVNPSLDVKTLKGLIDKGQSQTITFGSGSNGSPGHLAAAILGEAAHVKVSHIPYKGNSPAVLALVSGEVQAGILATPGLLPHVQAGKVVPLAVTSRKRSQIAPEVPTVAEAGLKELEVEVLYLMMVPAATPEPVMAVLRKAMADGLQQADAKAQLARLDLFVEAETGAEAQERIRAQRERYAKIIKATDMKIE